MNLHTYQYTRFQSDDPVSLRSANAPGLHTRYESLEIYVSFMNTVVSTELSKLYVASISASANAIQTSR